MYAIIAKEIHPQINQIHVHIIYNPTSVEIFEVPTWSIYHHYWSTAQAFALIKPYLIKTKHGETLREPFPNSGPNKTFFSR